MIATVPAFELTQLQDVESSAEAMATAGQVARGFLLLSRGLKHARALSEAQEPWGKELAQRYQEAMDLYSERHAMKTTQPGPSLWRVTLPEPPHERPEE
jgi:hypothetical protein